GTWFVAGVFLLLASFDIINGLPPNTFHRLLDLTVPEDEYLESPRRSVREANPESFSDYFKKLQLAQSELQKNASVGEEEIEKVFKNHGLDVGNETHDQNMTTTDIPESTTKQIPTKTDVQFTTSTQKPKKELCKGGYCSEYPGSSTIKPQKKQMMKSDVMMSKIPTSTLSSVTTSDEFDGNSTEPDTTVFPSTTSSVGWWGVSRRNKVMHLKSTIARQVVNKIKTSRRRTNTHFD
ncbi:hypothetical protein L9F63_028288, partial [Diploptera punctata]